MSDAGWFFVFIGVASVAVYLAYEIRKLIKHPYDKPDRKP